MGVNVSHILAAAAAAMTVTVVAAAAQSAAPLPDGPGKDTFAAVCSLCHDYTIPMGKQLTRSEWDLKVIEMLQEEPDVTREERVVILEYVVANFRPGGKIYINYADARDLQAFLAMTAREAEAIVRQRQTQGFFKSLDDVKKVSGVDSAKLDAVRERLVF